MPNRLSGTCPGSAHGNYVRLVAARGPLRLIGANGAIGANQKSFEHVAHQRHAIWVAWHALAINEDKKDLIDSAITYAFAHQSTDGGFYNGLGLTSEQSLEADSFFLSAAGHIELLLGIGNPGYGSAMEWLAANTDGLLKHANRATNRLWFAAQAFLLSAKVLEHSGLYNIGKGFAGEAIKHQHVDGWFDENGGWDSSYNAVSILRMGIILNYLPEGADRNVLHASLERSVAWQKSRISGNGKIDETGNTRTGIDSPEGKMVNWPEVAMALYRWSDIDSDRKALRLADAIVERHL